ncbi:pyridoxamine 5'-phosphate oxidase family protein [Oceanicoccus sp. KOV_DT_Chl]|uniref:pyridoxamine 5'-phosphate oxidase family protein n=1 Tax=Oceanicoccus sp. KOV_DT_Chl TaxID=1904639 RepID=UPI000C7C7652|nr:pyridoxamine 5'-phosphate oxidase family protein [Oceanicoccus sp. KOV_DT_Chl]
MGVVTEKEKEEFFIQVNAAAKQAIWSALATVEDGEPRVRMVHPTWEGDTLWFATGPTTPKALQIAAQPIVDVQFQVAPPDFIHLLVRGKASIFSDQATKDHAWNVIDYDLAQFWPDGPSSKDFVAIKIEPFRVELSEMFGTGNKRVWRA